MDIFFNVLANLMGAVAIILSTWAYIISKRETIYGDLDSYYLEVLKIGLETPQFRNPSITKDYLTSFNDQNERIAYETYAFISMNFCETLIDRVKKDKSLMETWYPAIRAEFLLHKSWIENKENHYKYKEEFRQYLNNEVLNFKL